VAFSCPSSPSAGSIGWFVGHFLKREHRNKHRGSLAASLPGSLPGAGCKGLANPRQGPYRGLPVPYGHLRQGLLGETAYSYVRRSWKGALRACRAVRLLVLAVPCAPQRSSLPHFLRLRHAWLPQKQPGEERHGHITPATVHPWPLASFRAPPLAPRAGPRGRRPSHRGR
jgi:hypothetical protein